MAPRTRNMRRMETTSDATMLTSDDQESSVTSSLCDPRSKLTPSQERNLHETISVNQIPQWMFDNAYILTGYRQEMGSYIDCLYSLLYVHNETGNIYSHLIGSLLYVVWLGYLLTTSSNLVKSTIWVTGATNSADADIISSITWKDFAVVSAFLVSAIACMGLSAAFHTFHCHSFSVSKVWNKLDFAGIAGLIAGSNIPFIYYAFYCETRFQTMYIAFMTTFGVVTTLITVSEKFSTPKYRLLRTSLFVGMGLASVIPIIHITLEHSYEYANLTMGLNHGIFGGICYLVGAFLYASRVPERFFPGKCDHWFQSHQIFHVLVLVATGVHFRGICLSVMHRHVDQVYACPVE
ncbi:hemolysin-III related-domain-containing protein [Obelidium mucronatum]|nr:hemolysin-III related-domain-containing protein [Obelidium mucronatum]